MKPFVSICIPTYNGDLYLRECLDSVQSQTYSDYEVIIVDDQSSDNTWEILNQYAKNNKRVHLYKNENNLGLVENWNRCVKLAQGHWIKFVFQDDLLSRDCLNVMTRNASLDTPFVVCQRNYLFHPEINCKNKHFYLHVVPQLFQLFPNTEIISEQQICNAALSESLNFIGEPTSTLIHRSIFERFGLFNTNMVQLCDLEFWIRIGINTGIKYIPEALVQFRIHPSSTSSLNNDSKRYRSRHLDKLILLHEFAYNPFYEALRELAKKTFPDRNFKKELAAKAYWLKNMAIASSSINKESQPIDQWNNVAKEYPKLEKSVYLIPHKAKHWFTNKLLWRLKNNL